MAALWENCSAEQTAQSWAARMVETKACRWAASLDFPRVDRKGAPKAVKWGYGRVEYLAGPKDSLKVANLAFLRVAGKA